MEQIPSSQFETQNSESKRKKWFLLFEIGLFETGFVLILLVSILGLLNYFNILKLNNFFHFLSSHDKIAIPTPTISIDQNAARITLVSYTTNNMQPDFIPSIASQSLPVKNTKNSIQTYWTSAYHTNFQASSFYSSLGTLNAVTIYAYTQIELPISTDSAQQLNALYFSQQKVIGTWYCREVKQTQICEEFGEGKDGKVGYGFIRPQINRNNSALVFCSIPKSSTLFSIITSCFTNFINTL